MNKAICDYSVLINFYISKELAQTEDKAYDILDKNCEDSGVYHSEIYEAEDLGCKWRLKCTIYVQFRPLGYIYFSHRANMRKGTAIIDNFVNNLIYNPTNKDTDFISISEVDNSKFQYV